MNRKEIEDVISDYHWRKREVDRLTKVLYGIGGNKPVFSGSMVAQYGIDAAMPKGSKGISIAEMDDADSRERIVLKKLKKYDSMVLAVEHDQELLDNDFHKTIYDCMMEGMSYRAIGKHLGISRGKLYTEKDTILDTLNQYEQKSHIVSVLHEQKELMYT